jgi:beta-phosphoglucomutase
MDSVRPGYEAILFDFDGVLVDSEPVHLSCWNQLLNDHFGYTVRWEEFAPNCVGVHERGTVEWLIAQRNPPVPFNDLWELYPRKKQLFRERMLMSSGIEACVLELFRELRGEYLLAVVTSSGRGEVEPILESSGMLGLIQTAVYGSDVRNLKPAPDPYLLACQRLGTQNALVVEDSEAGVASAKAAGLDVLQLKFQRDLCPAVRQRLTSIVTGGM